MYHAREVNYINSKVLNSFSYVVQSLNWKYKHVETKSVEARVKRPVIFCISEVLHRGELYLINNLTH